MLGRRLGVTLEGKLSSAVGTSRGGFTHRSNGLLSTRMGTSQSLLQQRLHYAELPLQDCVGAARTDQRPRSPRGED